jgi:hypothetical protein
VTPQLDYTKVPATTGRHRSTAYYGPNAPFATVKCGDCGRDADADFGDHGGDCVIRRTEGKT